MIIRDDELNRIAIDRFVSTSGLWLSVLAERFEPGGGGLRAYYLIIVNNATKRVRKVYRLCVDDPTLAYCKWEDWKQKFGVVRVDYMQEDEIPDALSELRWQPPFITEEDRDVMLKMKPKGSRIFVRDITPIDEVSARGAEAGLTIIVAEENKPRPTMGIILKINDQCPLTKEEGYKVGDIVMFSKHAGNTFSEAGEQYRSLDLHEIIGARDQEEGIEDLMPPEALSTAGNGPSAA